MVFKGLHGVTKGYRGDRGLLEVTGDYKGLQEVTMGYNGFQGVTGGYKGVQGVRRSYRRLHVFTGGYEGLQGVIRGYKRLKEVRSVKTAIKSRRSWRHMVSENEHSRNHELYTTETLRHGTASMD